MGGIEEKMSLTEHHGKHQGEGGSRELVGTETSSDKDGDSLNRVLENIRENYWYIFSHRQFTGAYSEGENSPGMESTRMEEKSAPSA